MFLKKIPAIFQHLTTFQIWHWRKDGFASFVTRSESHQQLGEAEVCRTERRRSSKGDSTARSTGKALDQDTQTRGPWRLGNFLIFKEILSYLAYFFSYPLILASTFKIFFFPMGPARSYFEYDAARESHWVSDPCPKPNSHQNCTMVDCCWLMSYAQNCPFWQT